jgi:hypothetical protein
MYRIRVFRSSYDGKPVANIREVETVEHNGETLYRDVELGTVERNYCGAVGERLFETREEAVTVAVAELRALVDKFDREVAALIDTLTSQTSEVAA